MDKFKFEGGQRTLFLGMIAVGVVSMVLTFFGDDALHTRFWTNYLHNTVFFLGISFALLFAYCAFTLAYAGWFVNFKRIWEAYSQFLLVALILMLPLIGGLWMDYHHLYHWNVPEDVATDPVLYGKSGFLNKWWYTLGTLIVVGIWYLCASRIRSLSLAEDNGGGASNNFAEYASIKKWAGILMFFGAFSSAAMIWQWLMSLDAHWYSTMFAWYSTASFFVAGLSLTIITIIYLKGKGYLETLDGNHLHDIGKYLFAFSIFWTYLWFDQYMLIWYANNGEETVYFQTRIQQYPVLFYGNLLINFVMPFFVLMRNSVKRKHGIMMFAAIMLFFGHWWDVFMMVKPGALHTAHEALAHGHGGGHGHEAGFTPGFTLPGLLEIGTFIGFLGLFMYVGFSHLSRAALTPANDPYLQESMHHEVI